MKLDLTVDFASAANNDDYDPLEDLGAGLGVLLRDINSEDTVAGVAAPELTPDLDASNGFDPYDTASLYVKKDP